MDCITPYPLFYQQTERRPGLPCGSGGVFFHCFSCFVLVFAVLIVCPRSRSCSLPTHECSLNTPPVNEHNLQLSTAGSLVQFPPGAKSVGLA